MTTPPKASPSTLRTRTAAIVGWAKTDEVMRLVREYAAQELRSAALDVDNETIRAILEDRANELTS